MVIYWSISLLAEDDERRNLTDREILDKYVDLETSCLTQKEKEEVIDILYWYKEEVQVEEWNGHMSQHKGWIRCSW